MKTIEENNKLIADFMEQLFHNGNTFIPEYNRYIGSQNFSSFFKVSELRYHESWDWLMPVVSKCRSLSNDEDSYWEVIYYTLEECEIITTYQAVIQFIEFYND